MGCAATKRSIAGRGPRSPTQMSAFLFSRLAVRMSFRSPRIYLYVDRLTVMR
jgi:hypothetical protein